MKSVPAVEMRGVGKRLGERLVLSNVTLSVDQGEVVALIGPSGSGKSTLLRCLNLLHVIDEGDILFFGRPVVTSSCCLENPLHKTESAARGAISRGRKPLIHVVPEEHRRQVGMVFQEFNLWEDRTVLSNVIEGPIHANGVDRKEAISKAEELLENFGLEGLAHRRPRELSGGQQQRVAFARALAMEPKVLLLDEVTSALDPELAAEVLALIRKLARKGLTMILVTHYLEFARDVADIVVMLDGGLVVECGKVEAVLVHPSQSRTQEFIGRVKRAR